MYDVWFDVKPASRVGDGKYNADADPDADSDMVTYTWSDD